MVTWCWEGVGFIALGNVAIEQAYRDVSMDVAELSDGALETLAIPVMEDDE